jgi:hypothetical protein
MLFGFHGSIPNGVFNTERLLIAGKITGVGGVAKYKALLDFVGLHAG